MTDVRPLNLTHVARIDTATGSTIEPPFNETWTDTQKIAWHAAVIAEETGLPIAVHAVGRDYAITVGHIAHSQRSFRDAWTLLNGVSTGALAAQRAREDGHTGACGATEDAGDPEPADDARDAHAGAQDRERCCVCGGVPIVYRNYCEQPFCQHCADCPCTQVPCVRTGVNDPAVSSEARIARLEAKLAQARSTVDRVTALAADMRTWCSPHDIAIEYADRIDEAIKGPEVTP